MSRTRQGNRPDRRFGAAHDTTLAQRQGLLQRVSYVGSAFHKTLPGDYGFSPPTSPRPMKSTCDSVRPILKAEAEKLFEVGILKGMMSPFDEPGTPKYVWSVDEGGEVYEAKTKPNQEQDYHGYRLGEDEAEMRRYILDEWKKR